MSRNLHTEPMTDLNSRYGNTPKRRTRTRIIAWSAAVGVALVTIAWAVWAGLGQQQDSIETHNLGHDAVDAHSTVIDFSITVKPGTPVRCAVQALDEIYGTVGWREVSLDPAKTWTTEHSVRVATSAQANNGLVYRCWLE